MIAIEGKRLAIKNVSSGEVKRSYSGVIRVARPGVKRLARTSVHIQERMGSGYAGAVPGTCPAEPGHRLFLHKRWSAHSHEKQGDAGSKKPRKYSGRSGCADPVPVKRRGIAASRCRASGFYSSIVLADSPGRYRSWPASSPKRYHRDNSGSWCPGYSLLSHRDCCSGNRGILPRCIAHHEPDDEGSGTGE